MESRGISLSDGLGKLFDAMATDPERLLLADSEFPLNKAVQEALPRSCRASRARFHGRCSIWFATGCVETKIGQESGLKYFIKYAVGEVGEAQLRGEFYSMQQLKCLSPELVPSPIGCGSLQVPGVTATFYVAEFIAFDEGASLDPGKVGIQIAELHRRSMNTQHLHFGTEVPTWDGVFSQMRVRKSTWTDCFRTLLTTTFNADRATNGDWHELSQLFQCTRADVISNLLGALEKDGRSVTPCFIHGDLWEGNFGIEKGTGRLLIFDANGYWAHFEMELAMWRVQHHGMYPEAYRHEYFRNMPPSDPQEQADDRNRLYSLKPLLAFSAHHKDSLARARACDEMRYLVDKYGRSRST